MNMDELVPIDMVPGLVDTIIVQLHREDMDVKKLSEISNVSITVIDQFLFNDQQITWQQLGDILYAIAFRRIHNGRK